MLSASEFYKRIVLHRDEPYPSPLSHSLSLYLSNSLFSLIHTYTHTYTHTLNLIHIGQSLTHLSVILLLNGQTSENICTEPTNRRSSQVSHPHIPHLQCKLTFFGKELDGAVRQRTRRSICRQVLTWLTSRSGAEGTGGSSPRWVGVGWGWGLGWVIYTIERVISGRLHM